MPDPRYRRGPATGLGRRAAPAAPSRTGRRLVWVAARRRTRRASLGPEYAIGVAGRSDDEEHRSSAVARVLDAYGRLDVLVDNTGINRAYGPLLDLDLGAARKTLEVNVVAALDWVRAAYRGWLGAHGGAVVNVASVAGLRPAGGIGLYGVSKAALIQLTAQLAMELAPAVRVNAVAPAVVKTRFAAALHQGREDEVAQAYVSEWIARE